VPPNASGGKWAAYYDLLARYECDASALGIGGTHHELKSVVRELPIVLHVCTKVTVGVTNLLLLFGSCNVRDQSPSQDNSTWTAKEMFLEVQVH